MERIIRLPDNQVIKNQRKINGVLAERKSLVDMRNATPPSKVIENIDLNNAVLSKADRNPIAAIELKFRRGEPFISNLYEIPDITIDLTPQAGNLPRDIVCYKLSAEKTEVSIEVHYNSTTKGYWEHYGNQNKIDEMVSKNLLEALQKKDWQCDWTGAWSVNE